jgi:murein DD-endopeptidase MepM/ murein hydrolase activator NlpD
MSITAQKINQLLQKHHATFANVVSFDPLKEHFICLDFTANNPDLSPETINETKKFSEYIDAILTHNNAKFGIGGYFEHRTIYARSNHFGKDLEEARRLHLGVDIWGAVNTPVFAFADGKVHSYAYNNHFGDYGATIILEHSLEDCTFYSLYGHLSLESLNGLTANQIIKKGTQIAQFGNLDDNGNWPPHLHFQLMVSMDGYSGDYPGVAKFSEKEHWLNLIPNPNLILKFEHVDF